MKKWLKRTAVAILALVAYVNIGHLVNEGVWRMHFYAKEAPVSFVIFPAPQMFGVGNVSFGKLGGQMRNGAGTFEEYRDLPLGGKWMGVFVWPITLVVFWGVAIICWIVQVLLWAWDGIVLALSFLFSGELVELMVQIGFWWNLIAIMMVATIIRLLYQVFKKNASEQR
ncbi:MAG: hypothetical protein Q7S84_03925 [bacterium]|nr:hypothetical protein [bacterium]